MSRSLRWGNPPTGVHNTPIYLALERGRFGPPGAVEARDNRTGADYTEALVAEAFDMGQMGTPPLFAALARSEAYVIVGQGLVRYPSFYVIAAPGVGDIETLRGSAVAINKRRTCPHSIVRTLLRRHGMGEEEIQLETLVDPEKFIEAIAAGRLAAACLWEPYVSYAERVFGWRVIADGRAVIQPSNYAFLLYARRALLEAEPEVVASLAVAYAAAVRDAVADLAAAARTLHGRIPYLEPVDIERGLRREAPNWTWDPAVDEELLEAVTAELRAQGVIPPGFDPAARLAPGVLRAAAA